MDVFHTYINVPMCDVWLRVLYVTSVCFGCRGSLTQPKQSDVAPTCISFPVLTKKVERERVCTCNERDGHEMDVFHHCISLTMW